MNKSRMITLLLVTLIFTGCEKTTDDQKNSIIPYDNYTPKKTTGTIKLNSNDPLVSEVESPYSDEEEYLIMNRGYASFPLDTKVYELHLNWDCYKKFSSSLPIDIHSDKYETHSTTTFESYIDNIGYMEQRIYWVKDLSTAPVMGKQIPTVTDSDTPFCVFKQRLIAVEGNETGINQPFKLDVSNKIKCIITFHNFDGRIMDTQNSTEFNNPVILEPGTHSLLVQE